MAIQKITILLLSIGGRNNTNLDCISVMRAKQLKLSFCASINFTRADIKLLRIHALCLYQTVRLGVEKKLYRHARSQHRICRNAHAQKLPEKLQICEKT